MIKKKGRRKKPGEQLHILSVQMMKKLVKETGRKEIKIRMS